MSALSLDISSCRFIILNLEIKHPIHTHPSYACLDDLSLTQEMVATSKNKSGQEMVSFFTYQYLNAILVPTPCLSWLHVRSSKGFHKLVLLGLYFVKQIFKLQEAKPNSFLPLPSFFASSVSNSNNFMWVWDPYLSTTSQSWFKKY